MLKILSFLIGITIIISLLIAGWVFSLYVDQNCSWTIKYLILGIVICFNLICLSLYIHSLVKKSDLKNSKSQSLDDFSDLL